MAAPGAFIRELFAVSPLFVEGRAVQRTIGVIFEDRFRVNAVVVKNACHCRRDCRFVRGSFPLATQGPAFGESKLVAGLDTVRASGRNYRSGGQEKNTH